jgi:RHS repeat-associated protein
VATYAPFGTPITPSGTEKFRFAGELLSGAAGSLPGLYYIGARWMDPELGRWLSLDPQLGKLSAPQTLNRYVYCVNNPLKFTDPTGEGLWKSVGKWWDKNWKTVAIVAAVVAITVVTGGAGGVLAAMAIGAASQGAIYAAEAGSSFSMQGLAINMGIGAAAGAIGYGAGAAFSKYAAPRLANALLSMESKSATGGLRLISKSVGLTKNEITSLKYAKPGAPFRLGTASNEGTLAFKIQSASAQPPRGGFMSDLPVKEAWGPYPAGNTADLLATDLIRPGSSFLYRSQPTGVTEMIADSSKMMNLLSEFVA